jgi:hypothetical protein
MGQRATGHIASRGPSGGDSRNAAKTEPDKFLGTYSPPVSGCRNGIGCEMPPFMYRCPNIGHHVQGFTAEEVSDDDTYQSVTFVHHVRPRSSCYNPAIGKVWGRTTTDDGDRCWTVPRVHRGFI